MLIEVDWHLSGDTNNTTSRTSTSVTSLLGLLVATLAKVVGTGVNDQGPAQNALSTNQLNKLVLLGADGITLGIGLEVTKVTDVALGVLGSTVGLAKGVEVRTSGGASVGVVTELVDVEATLGIGVVALDVPGDGGGRVLVGLLEGDSAGDLRVTTDDSN
jgi:hypothetical protein